MDEVDRVRSTTWKRAVVRWSKLLLRILYQLFLIWFISRRRQIAPSAGTEESTPGRATLFCSGINHHASGLTQEYD